MEHAAPRADQRKERPVPFNVDIVERARQNSFFREVLATGPHSQIVVPGGEIGEETHTDVDQVLVFVAGAGTAILDGERIPVVPDRLVLVPAGTRHNVLNTGEEDLRLYTI